MDGSGTAFAPVDLMSTGGMMTREFAPRNADALFERIGWQIDHLMSIDTRGKGIIPALYDAAVAVVNAPLAMTAAIRIRDAVKHGDVVGLITGFPSRSFLGRGITETDGPVGAVYLARVVEEVLGAVPVIITDEA